MRICLGIFSVAAILGGIGPASAEVPEGATALELVDQGFLHCSHPNVRLKTCRSIDSFEPIRERLYGSTSLVAAGNGVTLEVYTPLWLVDNALCGSIREQDLMAATVRLNGREVPTQSVAGALQLVVNENRALIDKSYCMRFERAGADFVGKVMVDDEYRPEFDTPIKLIRPTDGYRVAR